MDPRSLEAFCVLARTLNFRRAAEELSMSQPAFSVRVARLEDELGMALFERSRAGVTLLETGRQFLPHARDLLERLESARSTAAAIASGASGHLRIGYTPVSFLGRVPRIVRDFSRAFPQVRLELVEGLSSEVEEGLRSGRLDAGFLHPPVDDEALSLLPLQSDAYMLVLPSGHLHARAGRLPLAAVASEDFILVERRVGPVIYDRIIAMCTTAGFAPRIRQEVVNSMAVLGLVAAGCGCGFVISAMQTLRRGDVAFVAIEDGSPELPLALANERTRVSPTLAEFIRFVGANNNPLVRKSHRR
ncbi:MAG: LysR substrate-binding domain-containing protein [Devosia sp.]